MIRMADQGEKRGREDSASGGIKKYFAIFASQSLILTVALENIVQNYIISSEFYLVSF